MMNQILHDYLIENYGGYEYNSKTHESGYGTIIIGSYQIEVPYTNQMTPQELERLITEKQLKEAQAKLNRLPAREKMLKQEIQRLEKKLL